jgi:hypothetical protein
MNSPILCRAVLFPVIFLFISLTANAQRRNPLNLDKDFYNAQYKDNHVKRVRKNYKSAATQYTAEYQYDKDGYLTGFENDSAFARRWSFGNLSQAEIRYTPNHDKAFVINGSDTLHWLNFDEKKNLVSHRSARPGADSFIEVQYYYGDRGNLQFIAGRRDLTSDKWHTIQSFSYYYRDRKLHSKTTDTSHTMYSYDNQERLAEEYDSIARKGWKKYEYDEKDRVIAIYEMRPNNKDFTFCPYFTQNTYDLLGRLVKSTYAVSARNDKTGNCGYTLTKSVDYKYFRSGLLKKETGTGAGGQAYTIKYKYKK